jgi:DMSO/TMAO reductase YedYZ heme-binding membrane subunit
LVIVASVGISHGYFELMTSRRPWPRWVLLVPVVNLLAWVLLTPTDDGRSAFVRQVVAEMLGTTAVVLFAIALLLSTRARFLEPLFGGLDKMYRVHKETSVVGFLLLLAHVGLVPWRLEPGGGVPAGLIAFAGLLVLVVLTLGPRMRVTRKWVTLGYRTWKRTHRLIGVFFIFSCAHSHDGQPACWHASGGHPAVPRIWEPSWEPFPAAPTGRAWTPVDTAPCRFRPSGVSWTPVDTVWRSTDQEVGCSSRPGRADVSPGSDVEPLPPADWLTIVTGVLSFPIPVVVWRLRVSRDGDESSDPESDRVALRF